jgi:hypothetical protein
MKLVAQNARELLISIFIVALLLILFYFAMQHLDDNGVIRITPHYDNSN